MWNISVLLLHTIVDDKLILRKSVVSLFETTVRIPHLHVPPFVSTSNHKAVQCMRARGRPMTQVVIFW